MKDNEIFVRDWFSSPGDSIRSLMYRRGVTPHHLARHLDGGIDTLRNIFHGTLAIDHETAKALSVNLGGTTAFWLARQENYEQALADAVESLEESEAEEWLRQVLTSGVRPRGRLNEVARRKELRRRMAFYSVGTKRAWNVRYGNLREETRYRTSPSFASADGPLSLWLRQGELEAELVSTQAWNPDELQERLGAIRKLSKISRPTRFLPKLQALCAEAGIAVVFVRAPRGCRVSGASRLLTPEKGLILVSFRFRSDDQFWFTIFHEIGHLILHQGMTFVDDERTDSKSDYEWQANRFASSCIIPALREAEFENLTPNRESVIRFSVSVDVAPGLIVGQMQHRGMIGYNRLNGLKRRWRWQDIQAGLA